MLQALRQTWKVLEWFMLRSRMAHMVMGSIPGARTLLHCR